MNCAACGAELPTSGKFCPECGEAVKLAAPPAPEPIEARIPGHLAEKIRIQAPSLEGERKQVTVLFADVHGSMDLQEELDAEEWHRVMNRFFSILCEGVYRFEGTVDKFTGDGMMAIFGAPIAHEDHPQRACFSALHLLDRLREYAHELRRSHGLNFSVRMGINSGEVIVGGVGDDLSMAYTAVGPTVGLASRMEALAEPGSAYLTSRTAGLVEGYVRLRDLGEFTIKGVREPVHAYQLEGVGGARGRFDVSRARGLSLFVGRQDELGAIEEAFARADAGEGRAIGIVGEPGVGKSRLCHEFVERCRAKGITVRTGHALPYGRAVPLSPILEILRDTFNITDRDSDQHAREKIAGRLLLLDPSFADALPLVFDFLGVPDPERPAPRMEPEARQEQLSQIFRQMVHTRSRREPAVILFEDLHWLDVASEAFVDALVDALPGSRTLAIANYRPEHAPRWLEKDFAEQIALRPLGPEAVEELVGALLGTDPSLAGLPARIRERTRGNPFFIEEIVRTLVEAGALEGERGAYRAPRDVDLAVVPSTVEAVLAARIDRLGEEQKAVLQAASVVGKEFTQPVLARVAGLPDEDLDAALRALVGAEFVYEQSLYPEPECAFTHPLTQEVAYRSQLGERRARLHAEAARALIELYPERLDERAALVAHHWEAAGEFTEAARWTYRAASWVGMNDLAEGYRLWRTLADLLDRVPESPEVLNLAGLANMHALRLGWRHGLPEEEADRLFEKAKGLAERAGNLPVLAIVHQVYGSALVLGGRGEIAFDPYLTAVEVADRSGDTGLRVMTRMGAVVAYFSVGRAREAVAVAEEAIALAAGDEDAGAALVGYSPLGTITWAITYPLMQLGRLDEARRFAEQGLEIGRRRNESEVLGWSHAAFGFLAWRTGDASLGIMHGERALEIGERVHNAAMVVFGLAAIGNAHEVAGRWTEAREARERALAIGRERRSGLNIEPWILAGLARALVNLDEPDRALDRAEEALAAARRIGYPGQEIETHLAASSAVLRRDGPAARGRAEEALDAAERLIEQLGSEPERPRLSEARAELAAVLGDGAARERHLREALRLYAGMGAAGHAARVEKELASG